MEWRVAFCLPAAHPEQCSPQCFHFITVEGTITFSSKHCSQPQYLPPRKSNNMSTYFKHLTWRLLQSTSLWLFIWLRVFLSNWEYTEWISVQAAHCANPKNLFFLAHLYSTTCSPSPCYSKWVHTDTTETLMMMDYAPCHYHRPIFTSALSSTPKRLSFKMKLKENKQGLQRGRKAWGVREAAEGATALHGERRKQCKRKISSERTKQKHIQWWHKFAQRHLCTRKKSFLFWGELGKTNRCLMSLWVHSLTNTWETTKLLIKESQGYNISKC